MHDARFLLVERRDAVAARLHAVEDPGATGRGDEADLSVHADQRDFAVGGRARLAEQFRRIEAALARLAAGDYGLCVDCGDVIKAARLKAIPEVETCLTCQAERERNAVPLQSRVTRSRVPGELEDA